MDVVNRENVVIAVGVILAVLAWYGVEEYTDFGTPVALAVLIAIGIFLPAIVLYFLPGEDYSS